MTKAKRKAPLRWRIIRSGAVVFMALSLMITAILIAWAVPMGDFAAVEPAAVLADHPAAPRLQHQIEGHTCGYHAVSMIYAAYGVDADERRLGPRLGVDNQAVVHDPDSTGTIHPDIYRAMSQDGFDVFALDLDDEDASARLQTHLAGGGLALALIRRHESGGMHWVVLHRLEGDDIWVYDPLETEVLTEGLGHYWDRRLLSVLVVSPRHGEMSPVWKLHLRGTADMLTAYKHSRDR